MGRKGNSIAYFDDARVVKKDTTRKAFTTKKSHKLHTW